MKQSTHTTPSLTPTQAMTLARGLINNRQLVDAEKIYRAILNSQPDYHPAYHGLGLLAYRVGKLEVAIDMIRNATLLNNQVLSYHCDLCEMYRLAKRLDEAIESGQRAIALESDNVDAHYNLAVALTDKEALELALQHYRRVLELNPKHGMALNNIGSILEKMGDRIGAETAYRQAVEINPKHAEAQNNLGTILSELGNIDEAAKAFDIALSLQPHLIAAHHSYSTIKTYTSSDPQINIMRSLLGQQARLESNDRIKLHFALGKALDDLGDYRQAFSLYQRGNQLKRQILPSQEALGICQTREVIRYFDNTFFEKHRNAGIQDSTPIFIVGMPRSGTTLLEQILSSHPLVYGAGELKTFHEAVGHLPRLHEQALFAESAQAWSDENLRDLANEYIEEIRKLDEKAARITDKMPANFFYIGLIASCLPNAKIIHSMRDPMDSCLSNYIRLFNDSMDFAYDLETLGNYYVRYMQVMDHWRKVLPTNAILDVHYEQLVSDTETQTRRILDFVGLPWDDNCLNYHKNKRRVRTASIAQVRKPIYNSSVGSWKRFETELQPLLHIVKNYRDAYVKPESSNNDA